MAKDILALYDETFDNLYRYVYFKVGNKWDADDLVSEVYTRACAKLPGITGDSRAWLFTVARNAVTDFYRSKGRLAADEDIEAIPDLPFEEELESKDEIKCLQHALVVLTTEQREVINLKYFAGLKTSQIAVAMELTENAVKMRLHRTLVKVKELVVKCLLG